LLLYLTDFHEQLARQKLMYSLPFTSLGILLILGVLFIATAMIHVRRIGRSKAGSTDDSGDVESGERTEESFLENTGDT
jgi:hypothetical protein